MYACWGTGTAYNSRVIKYKLGCKLPRNAPQMPTTPTKISGDDVDIYTPFKNLLVKHTSASLLVIFLGASAWLCNFCPHQCVHWPPWHKSKSQINQTRLCCKPFGITSRFIHFLHHGSSLTILPGKGRLELSTSRNVWEAWVIAEMPSISCNTSVASPNALDVYIYKIRRNRLDFDAHQTPTSSYTALHPENRSKPFVSLNIYLYI